MYVRLHRLVANEAPPGSVSVPGHKIHVSALTNNSNFPEFDPSFHFTRTQQPPHHLLTQTPIILYFMHHKIFTHISIPPKQEIHRIP